MKISQIDIQPRISSPTCTVYSYPSNLSDISLALIKITGRHPNSPNTQFIEHKCHVIFYIISGIGKVIIDGQEYSAQAGDVISVNSGSKYFLDGNMEYVAATSPAYSKDQNEVISMAKT